MLISLFAFTSTVRANQQGMCSDASYSTACVEDPQLRLLLARQEEVLPRALQELEVHGRKVSHWAWWAFPTEMAGMSEPAIDGVKTRVTKETAPELLRLAPPSWIAVLEKICELVTANGSLIGVLPAIDHGRVKFFVLFWETVEEKPTWLVRVLHCLRSHT